MYCHQEGNHGCKIHRPWVVNLWICLHWMYNMALLFYVRSVELGLRSQNSFTGPCNGIVSHGAPIGGIRVFIDHTCGNECKQNATTIFVQQFHACLYFQAQFAVYMHTWRITIVFIVGKTYTNTPIWAPYQDKMVQVLGSPFYFCGTISIDHKINKNTDRTREGLCLILRPTPVPCARDSVTRACTYSRERKALQLRDKSTTLSRVWVVIVRHFNHARRGRALAAISGKVPSVSGVCNRHYSYGCHFGIKARLEWQGIETAGAQSLHLEFNTYVFTETAVVSSHRSLNCFNHKTIYSVFVHSVHTARMQQPIWIVSSEWK